MIGVQRRLTELGRIRLGEKGPKGEPRKLTKFRLTTASKPLLDAAARLYGGTVRAWQDAPDEGYWELFTETDALDIMVPPVMSAYSQLYEVWDAGGCTLRCDGTWESIAQVECSHGDHEGMRVTTRVSVILPKLPGLGTWRLETHGWNAAATLPASLDMLTAAGARGWIPAILRLQQESSKKKVNGRSQTFRYVVPVVDVIGVTIAELLAAGREDGTFIGSGETEPQRVLPPGPSRPPRGTKVDRPQLGPPPTLPETSDFRADEQPPVAPPSPPPSISGWAVAADDEPAPERPRTPASVPAAAERRPQGRRGTAAAAAPPPEPLAFDEFSRRVRESGATENDVIEATRLRFPSAKRLSELSDEERGRLFADIERMVETSVSA